MTNPREQQDQPIPQDELDSMLRRWHAANAQQAAANRSELTSRLAASLRSARTESSPRAVLKAALANRHLRAAASFLFLAALISLLVPLVHTPALAAQREVMLPDGGRLEARDDRGQLIGPCALAHTDVKINVTGPFTRVKVRQQFQNPYISKIEAVYTFPLSNRAAVDSMSMTIGDRVVIAEMKERGQARQIYESARNQGYVASLLEQERPNIFTQSVANIEPGADIIIEISYVEILQSRNGEYSLAFPMVVAPRYIPGSPLQSQVFLPAELQPRCGSILLGPATFERMKVEMVGQPGNGPVSFNKHPIGPAPYLQRVIDAARPIHVPAPAYRGREAVQQLYRSNPSFDFNVVYADGSREFGQIAGDGLGHIAGRWFYFDPAMLAGLDATRQADQPVGAGAVAVLGTGYEPNTTQVPDASRITPMPVRPPKRAGHDISLSASIDTGGPAIIDYRSDLHDIVCTDGPRYRDLGNKVNLALRNQRELPNRDFVLSWKTLDEQIQESTFAYVDPKPRDAEGGFFTLILAPPARVADDAAMPRELIFVLDTSGSMQGLPIEKAKAVMSKAIDAMRPRDTFNLITFSGDTHILWDVPRSNTPANRQEAQNFLASRQGNGGTEMMSAINAALAPSKSTAPITLTPEELANLPADGREVLLRAALNDIEANVRKNAIMQPVLRVRQDLAITLTSFQLPVDQIMQSPDLFLRGKWSTHNGERILQIASAEVAPKNPASPLRIVMFLTDGQVGNDVAIIQAVRANARTTRVFGFGIGDSPNRNLLDGIAQAGRGEVEYVNLQSNPDEAVQRFVTRIGTPVLTDIHLSFSDNLKVSDTIPPLDAVPDLFDLKPMVLHGRYLPLPQGEGRGEGETGVGVAKQEYKGQLTITGNTGAGPYTRTIDLDLSQRSDVENDHAVIATLWARAKVDELQKHPDATTQENVTALGEQYSIMTPYTSFVAVEKARLTIAGRSVLVPVPIELPEGMTWEGTFGGEGNLFRQAIIDRVLEQGVDAAFDEVYQAQRDQRFDDALVILDAILVVDPNNQAGMALRDIIASTDVYRDYKTTERQASAKRKMDNVGGRIEFPWQRSGGTGSHSPTVIRLNHANAQQLATELNGLLAEVGSGTGLDRPATGLGGRGLGGVADPSSLPGVQLRSGTAMSWAAGLGDSKTVQELMDEGSEDVQTTTNVGMMTYPSDWPQLTMRRTSSTDPAPTTLEQRDAAAEGHSIGYGLAVGSDSGVFGEVAASQPGMNTIGFTYVDGQDTLFVIGPPEYRKALEEVIRTFDKPTTADQRIIDILDAQSVQVDFPGNSIEQVIDFFRQVTGLKIYADWKALQKIGVLPTTEVTLQLKDVRAGQALTQILSMLGTEARRATYIVRDEMVVISTPDGVHPAAARVEAERPNSEQVKQIAEAKRLNRLRRIIDRRLWEFVDELAPKPDAQAGSTLAADLTQKEKAICIILSVRDVSDPALNQLREAGLTINDIAKSQKVIAGSIAAEKLDDLAMLEVVRRIEPLDE